jgi:hypothetical protein
MSFVFYPIKISFHETLVQVIPLGNILAIDLYPFKKLLLFNGFASRANSATKMSFVFYR